jgi:hypothetical protein
LCDCEFFSVSSSFIDSSGHFGMLCSLSLTLLLCDFSPGR